MITVALSPDSEAQWLLALPTGMAHWPCRYEALTPYVEDWPLYVIGTALCSCDLFHPPTDTREQSLRRKYQKQGWSGAKIERALSACRSEGFAGALHPDLRHWLSNAVTEAGEAYLFVHWESAEIVIDQEVQVTTAEFQRAAYPVLAERLYHIGA